MREVKFRAWDKENKQMGKVINLFLSKDGVVMAQAAFEYGDEQQYHWRIRFISPDNLVLMQSTGFKDKNGKEIYESDIVKLDTPNNPDFPTRNKQIIFNQKFAQFCVELCTAIMGWKSIEVIGNATENPELLEEKQE